MSRIHRGRACATFVKARQIRIRRRNQTQNSRRMGRAGVEKPADRRVFLSGKGDSSCLAVLEVSVTANPSHRT
jgi:hypothetical protein